MFSNKDFRKEINPYVKDGGTWKIDMFDNDGKKLISYYWYGPGGNWDDDENTPHNGVGSLAVNQYLVDSFRKTFTIRQSKVLDIIADWVSETLDVDIDEVEMSPKTGTPTY